ncbi:Protein-export membrane protein SecG [Enhygromyxa salina]|uniref:Protein-export membrane protein SecG n=1 Tax=Enhygromyxa salina TaxID=215803 RepID=A0A2S9XW80_9BACT|nr:preprotein translocase subunit SecG [Enhygromyxa salina]PRP97094.1 Protein-export membrane protein SecG [Enhygromyxa salina]
MTTFITIIYVIVALIMVLSILLQAGKGGGLGSALGGGASQGVFGGGGGADFMSKLTQGFAATFMICAMYLAYASAHVGSEFLESEDQGSEGMLEADEEINYERLGPRPQPLPTAEEGKAMQAEASAMVPAQSAAPLEMIEEAATEPEPAAEPDPAPEQPAKEPADEPGSDDGAVNGERGDSPDEDRGDSPQSGESIPQDAAPDDKKTTDDTSVDGPDEDQAG